MDENVGGGGYAGHPGDHFHRNEAISAVTDDGFLAEEEDDDFDDLYNDVNVGEHFHNQSISRPNQDFGVRKEESLMPAQPNLPAPPAPQPQGMVDVGAGGGDRNFDDVGGAGGARPLPSAGYHQQQQQQNMGFRGPGGVGSSGGGGLRVELGPPSTGNKDAAGGFEGGQIVTNNSGAPNQMVAHQPQPPSSLPPGGGGSIRPVGGNMGNVRNPEAAEGGIARQVGGGNMNGTVGGNGFGSMGGSGVAGGGGQGTILFVGDLHWWTTDAELEMEASKYGSVKEVKFYDEKASGKSKGYCQVEFYDPAAATACKEGMNGHLFNGRPCVVAYASPHTVKRMGEAQVSRNQQMAAQTTVNQGRRGGTGGEVTGKPTGYSIATGGNYQGGENNRGFGRGNWGRGNSGGMGGRGGPMGGPMRGGRGGGMGGRGMMGNGGNGFGPGMGAAPGPLLHPQAMMGQGFDPGFGGGHMARMGNYGGFPGGPAQPFSGLLPAFPPNVGLPGVAPHVNPAFFGRGMPLNGMGMMHPAGVEGPNMGMWGDPNMSGGWGGEEHGSGRAGESSFGDDAVSDHQYGEVNHDRAGPWPNSTKEKDRGGSEKDWSETSERRYRDDREPGYDREKDVGHETDWSERRQRDERDAVRGERERDRELSRDRERSRDRDHRDRDHDRDRRHRDDRDRYADHHRYRDRESGYDEEWDRGRSSRMHSSKSRVSHGEEQRSRSRDAEYGKRRRLTSE